MNAVPGLRCLLVAAVLTLAVAVGAPASASVAGQTPRVVARVDTQVVAVGQPVRVFGTVGDTGGSVSVERRAGSHWLLLTRLPVARLGGYSGSVAAPGSARTWQLRVVRGTQASGVLTVRVVSRAYRVRVLPVSAVATGQAALVTGSVSPAKGGPVLLQVRTGRSWRTVSQGAVVGSQFRLRTVPVGGSVLRVLRAASHTVAAGTSVAFTVAVYDPPHVADAGLPGAMVGLPYRAELFADGGVAPYQWSVAGLPPGIAAVGAWLQGTPTVAGTSTVQVTVADALGHRQTASLPLAVALAPTARQVVRGWGTDAQGQLGDAGAGAPASSLVPGLAGVTAVATGARAGYAVRFDGTVWAWGDDGSGVLRAPGPVPGVSAVTAVAAAGRSAYALSADGKVWGWGDNSHGQLGAGVPSWSARPVLIAGVGDVVRLVAGDGFVVAERPDRTVWAWGAGSRGQLGDGVARDSAVPVQVQGLAHVAALAAGPVDGYAVEDDGSVWAWGADEAGQLGGGPAADGLSPRVVAGLSGATAVAGCRGAGFALLVDGTVRAWGTGPHGELGVGSATFADSPTPVVGLTGVTAIAAAAEDGYALSRTGTVAGWGGNADGELGTSALAVGTSVPVMLVGSASGAALAAGGATMLELVRG